MSEAKSPNSLAKALDFHLSELLDYDFWVGLLIGIGSAWLAASSPKELKSIIPIAAGLVGAVIAAIIAGVAILGAFLDQAFLRKLKRIDKEPVRYMAPFLFTATLGIAAAIFMLVLYALPESKSFPHWIRVGTSFVTGTAIGWTLASVLPALRMLVRFVGLQMVAADVEDETDVRHIRGVQREQPPP